MKTSFAEESVMQSPPRNKSKVSTRHHIVKASGLVSVDVSGSSFTIPHITEWHDNMPSSMLIDARIEMIDMQPD